jgi:hypothetical protein
MHEPARLATTAVSLPPASERLNVANSETAPNRGMKIMLGELLSGSDLTVA